MKTHLIVIFFCLSVAFASCSFRPEVVGLHPSEYEKCRMYEKEILVAVEYSGSGRESALATFNVFEMRDDMVFQIDEHMASICLEDLPQLYERAVFITNPVKGSYDLAKECPKLKIRERDPIAKKLYISSYRLGDELYNLTIGDTSYNFLIIKDRTYGMLCKIEDNKGALHMCGKTGQKFIGHIFRTYRVKLRYVYLGKRNYDIPNFNLKSGVHLASEKGCNTFLVFEIISVKPVNLNHVD